MHAIDDKAFDQATRAIKAALDDYPRTDHRHGIIHDCLPTEEGVKICKDYGILMPIQSAFINWKQEPDEYLESIMGIERCNQLNPLRTFWDNGIVLSAGSDAPCTTPDPISWNDRAVNHENPYTVDKSELKNLKVEQLILGGHKYHSCKENVAGTVIRGLTSKSKC